jgi:hypothetical protein
MDPVTRVLAHTDLVMQVPAHTGPVTQAPSRSRLAIGRITPVALVIMWARPITSGFRDIGRVVILASGSTATMW